LAIERKFGATGLLFIAYCFFVGIPSFGLVERPAIFAIVYP